MKMYFRLVVFFILFSGVIEATAQERKYLLHTQANIERLQGLIGGNEEIAESWKEQLRKADELAEKGSGKHEDLHVLALVYRMTGEDKYAEEIRKNLLKQVRRDRWEGGDLLNRTPPWRAGLGVAHTSFSVALGFDAAYNYLSSQDRKEIAEGMVKLGIQPMLDDWLSPLNNIHTLDTMGHNWWSSVVFMGGYAALAIRNEIPEAVGWVKQISDAAEEWVTYSGSLLQNKISSFDRDGGFWESINYAAFGVGEYLKFRLALNNVMPEYQQPQLDILNKIADFFVYTTYYRKNENPLVVNFGDGSLTRTGNACLMLLYNLGYQNKQNAWYLKYTHSGNDDEALQTGTPNGLILFPELPEIEDGFVPKLPTAHLFADIEWASLRSSWQENSTMLAVKSGFTWNHAHADAGSFILFHNGENLLIDSGNSYYSHPLYSDYYAQSEAHNVILFDEKGQDRKDHHFGTVNRGSLNHLIDGKTTKYILADASGPYAQYLRRNYRSFLWQDNVILIIDDLLAHEPGKFEWLLHYDGESGRRGKNISVQKGDARVLVHPLYPETLPDGGLPHDFPEKMRLSEKQGYEGHHPGQTKSYWSISHFEETQRTKLVNAIILENEDEARPRLERFEGKNYLGVRIFDKDQVTEVYINLLADGRIKHRNSINTMNGWETDAYISAITFPEGADRHDPDVIDNIFIAHGSYLRRDGKVLVHALSKFYTEINYTDDLEISFDGQEGAKLFVRSPQSGNALILNGKAVNAEKNERLQGIELEYHEISTK